MNQMSDGEPNEDNKSNTETVIYSSTAFKLKSRLLTE